MAMSNESFSVLGLPPTLDPAAVKRAYFAALARHPPHQDPEGFRQVREAYETLSRPGALVMAYLASPVDVERLAHEARERFDAALEKARETALAARAGQEAAARFQERCARMRWDEALRACAGEPVR
ncbi:J domain-containing protein [Hyalangium versicolor]|uniref:J domain-containing protein n=1 Tax=Hyalangium versicolor TaxID=2861190 RepID=UPI001CCAD6FA|nr:J domain-containing protein [Hyalangium versicolor]